MLTIKLVKIDSKLVEASPDDYNSSFHRAEEAPGLEVPTEAPCAYKRWLRLIARSQNIPSHLIQTISLSPSQGRLLAEAAEASIVTRVQNRVYAEELEQIVAPAFKSLSYPVEGLFLRLDACSPKDGVSSLKPLRCVENILLRVTTSSRAKNAIQDCLDRREESISFYFMPFNNGMNTALEYRVFCSPLLGGSISAISQYKWHAPCIFKDRSEKELEEITTAIADEAVRIHGQILEEVRLRKGEEMDRLLLKQGFSFDIMYCLSSKTCFLIELNPFGARSGCGACLYHWVRDLDVLYGNVRTMTGKCLKR